MRRVAFAAAVALLAILIQLTVLGNVRLPGGAGPDLVLVVVVALALTGGPVEGMLGGFFAGLALDVAPPATHLVGQYALVFCVVGYATGRVGSKLDESTWVPIGVVAVGSAVGELLFALTGMIFGNLDITWSTIGHVLPASVVYDVLLSPFVLYAVVRARALAAPTLTALGLAAFPGGSARGPATGRARPGRRGGPVRRVRRGAARQRHRAGAEAESPHPAGRVHPGRVGQRVAARPHPPVPAGPPEVQRRRRFRPVRRAAAAATRARQGLASRPVHLHLGTRRRFGQNRGSRPGGARAQGSWQRGGGIPARAFSRSSGISRSGAFSRSSAVSRVGGTLGDGAGGRALRPSRGPRLRGGVMQGGSASGARAVGVRIGSRPARPVHLRLGAGRRRDGAIGGSVLGRRPRGSGLRAREAAYPPVPRGQVGRPQRPPGPGQRPERPPRVRPAPVTVADLRQAVRRSLSMIPASRRRLIVLYVVVAALLISLGGRLWYLQVMNGRSYVQLAALDQTQTVITPAVRGQILDDAGLPMVDNASSLVVTVNIMNLATQSDGGAAVLRRLAHLLGMSDKLLTQKVRLCNAHVSQPCWPGSPYQPIPVAEHVPDSIAVQIMQDHASFPGVSAGVNPVARYPQPNGANPAQVLGYLRPDHRPADEAAAPAHHRVRRRGPGRPGRPGSAVQQPARRAPRASRCCP